MTTNYPAITGDAITERHARICREQGHATWTRDGRDVGQCPRCGHVEPRATATNTITPEIAREAARLRAAWTANYDELEGPHVHHVIPGTDMFNCPCEVYEGRPEPLELLKRSLSEARDIVATRREAINAAGLGAVDISQALLSQDAETLRVVGNFVGGLVYRARMAGVNVSEWS